MPCTRSFRRQAVGQPAVGAPMRTLALLLPLLAAGCFGFGRTGNGEVHIRQDLPAPADGDFGLALFESVDAKLQPGHAVKLLDNGAIFSDLLAEIPKAKTSFNLVTYIWSKGT